MKKNFGNAIVKKGITLAMAAMLVASSISMDSTAAESLPATSLENIQVNQEAIDTAIEEAEKALDEAEKTVEDIKETIDSTSSAITSPKESVEAIVENINKNDTLTDDQKDLLTDITTDLGEIDSKQNAVVIIDQSKEIIEDNVENAIEDYVGSVGEGDDTIGGEVGKALDEVKKELAETKEDVNSLTATIGKYEEVTNDLLNNSDTISASGEITLEITDEEGNTTEVNAKEYTAEKAQDAKNAHAKADAAFFEFTSNMTATNAAEQREKIDEAVKAAEAAKNDAENAYNAAKSTLLDEIKTYNAYAAKYGHALYEYDGNFPSFTEEELAALPELKAELDALNKSQSDLNISADKLASNKMDEQLAEIIAATDLVSSINGIVTEAQNAVNEIAATEDAIVEQMTQQRDELAKNLTDAESNLANAKNDWEKKLFQAQYDVAKAAHDLFANTLYDYTEKEHDADDPNNKGVVTIQGRFDYAVEAAGSLATEINGMVADATEKLNNATTAYDEAKKAYEDLQKEYAEYLEKNIIDDNFKKLKEKLDSAKANVDEAFTNVKIASDAVTLIEGIQSDFEKKVASIPTGGSSSSSDASDDDDSSSSSSTPSATTASTVAIDENIVPLAGTVPAVEVPLTTIAEEPAPLADEVPKTGDASTAAGAVGASGLVAMLGALFMSIKKRTLR